MYLTLVRGLPGSGKSTIATGLADQAIAAHIEADQFFMVGGSYRYDASMLADAHAWALGQATYHLAHGTSVVISNTFTTNEELEPYVRLAQRFNALLQLVTVEMPNMHDVALSALSTHEVPEKSIEAMRARWQPFRLGAEWPLGSLGAKLNASYDYRNYLRMEQSEPVRTDFDPPLVGPEVAGLPPTHPEVVIHQRLVMRKDDGKLY